MILYHLKCIGISNPSQWEAINEHGQRVYIRFRFDSLQVHCPFIDGLQQGYEAFMATQILRIDNIYGEPFKGYISDEEMLRLTGYTVGETR